MFLSSVICFTQVFSDDTAILGLLHKDKDIQHYTAEIDNDMINNEPIRQVASYKYLLIINVKSTFLKLLRGSCCCIIMPVMNPSYCMV
jgi:hypothetical protein